MTATARKMSFENKHLRNCECYNYPILFVFYNVGAVRHNRICVPAVKLNNRELEIQGWMPNLSTKA